MLSVLSTPSLCLYPLISHIGFALLFCVFQVYYSAHEPFRGNQNIPVIGTLTTSVVYLGAPLHDLDRLGCIYIEPRGGQLCRNE